MEPRTSVMVVDSHPVARYAIQRTVEIQPNFECLLSAEDTKTALDSLKRRDCLPDILITEIYFPNQGGIDFIKEVRSHYGLVRILVYTLYDESYAHRAFRAGVSGYVTKNQPITYFIAALNKVATGEQAFSEKFKHSMNTLERIGADISQEPEERLSDREEEIYLLLGDGKTSREISSELGITPKTVGNVFENIKRKLGVRSKKELEVRAVRYSFEKKRLPIGK